MQGANESNQEKVIIAAGMPRAGSSWLYRNLSLHPHANISKLKEINYFSINFERGDNWFTSLYNNHINSPKFDISPFYFLDPEFEEKVKASSYQAKLIIILREPNHWVRSLYYQIKSFTLKMPPFSEFIKEHTINFDNRPKIIRLRDFDFLGRVNALISAFKGNVLLVNFDLIKNDPVILLSEIEKFGSLPSYFNESNIIKSQVNASQSKFKWLYYLSTNRYLRSVASKLPFPTLIKFIQKKLYKENQTNLTGISNKNIISEQDKYELLIEETNIDEQFPPVFKKVFFTDSDIVYL